MNSALIFVCSDQVGPYVNVLSYLRDKRDVTEFTFVFVTGAMMEGPQTAYVETIRKTLEDLANGKYLGRPVTVDQQAKASYGALAANLGASSDLTETVSLEELALFLARRTARARPHQLVVDVTGLPKILMAHVLLICLAGGYKVHAFELRHKANRGHPELSLYFSLPTGSFDYPPLTRDPAVQSSVRQLIPLRNVMWTTAGFSAVGVICFTTLLFVASNNKVLAVVGLVANVVGIAGATLQAITTRKGQ